MIGTGAVGGYYGGMLARAGHEVHFLLRGDYEQVAAGGLRVDSCDGQFILRDVRAYRSTADMPQCDVVIVALKSTANGLLAAMLPPVVGPHTVVVLIQNGISLEQDLQAACPGLQIAAGLAFICSAKTAPGHIIHQSGGMLNIGNFSCADTQVLDRFAADLAGAGVRTAMVEYGEARWKKAVWNMPFNGLSVVLRATTDRLLANASAARLVRSLMGEVVGAARACGVENIDSTFADKMIGMTMRMPPYSPSMKLDYENGRQMEIGYLYTVPVAMARSHGFRMAGMEMLEAELRFIEQTRTPAHGAV